MNRYEVVINNADETLLSQIVIKCRSKKQACELFKILRTAQIDLIDLTDDSVIDSYNGAWICAYGPLFDRNDAWVAMGDVVDDSGTIRFWHPELDKNLPSVKL